MDQSHELFKGVTFSDLMSDVYHNSRKKSMQINKLIDELKNLIKTTSDATIVVPLIKEYLDISVKNDDHLVKLAGIVQRFLSAKQKIQSDDEYYGLSDEEKQQLINQAQSEFESEMSSEITNIVEKADDLKTKQTVSDVKKRLKKT